MKKQRGYIRLDGFFEMVLVLAIIGAVAVFGLAGWGVWWLIEHVKVV